MINITPIKPQTGLDALVARIADEATGIVEITIRRHE